MIPLVGHFETDCNPFLDESTDCGFHTGNLHSTLSIRMQKIALIQNKSRAWTLVSQLGVLAAACHLSVTSTRAETAQPILSGFEFRGLEKPQSIWIETMDRWLKDHRKATGQTFVIVIQSPPAPKTQALHELATLPMTTADRKDACVFLNEIALQGGDQIQSRKQILECGLGVSMLMENERIQLARLALEGARLPLRAWEARTMWVVLELLHATESPILIRELRDEIPETPTPTDLIRYIKRWHEASTSSEAHELPLAFDPEQVLEEEDLNPPAGANPLTTRLRRAVPDYLFGALILILLFVASKTGKIARTPAFRATSSGFFRIRLASRIKDRIHSRLRLLNKTAPVPHRFATITEDCHVRL